MFWIVINNTKGSLLRHDEKYRLFDDKDKAVKYAESLGYVSDFFGISDKPGMASVYMAGGVDILILPTIIES